MRSQQKNAAAAYEAFGAERHLCGAVGICRSLGWDNFGHDPDLTRRSPTAPGVTTIIAVARETDEVVGFAQVFGDGVVRAHLGLLAVDEAFARSGAVRMDLISSDESPGFYRSLRHREQAGFRI